MDLHELERINRKACLGEPVIQCKAERKDAFLPVKPEPAEDMPYMALVDLAVSIEDRVCRTALKAKDNDILLILFGYLGIRDYQGRQDGMGLPTEAAPDTLDSERKEQAE